jgi:glucosamine--fructose-6-phosphate aminotransferase (isomerizing)
MGDAHESAGASANESAYASGMRADIADIPSVVARALVDDEGTYADLAADFARRAPAWVTIAARGSSDHAAVYAQYLIESYLGLPAGLALPSVTTVYDASIDWRTGAVLAISQSGESPDVRAVVDAARAGGALTVAITNEPGSPLANAAEHVLLAQASVERAIPATKTYVGCLAAVARLVASIRPDGDLVAPLAGLPDLLAVTIERSDAWLAGEAGHGLVGEMARAERALVVSRGYNLATALEVALKLKEGCGLFAAGYSSADVMHGPMVVAMPGVPMLVIRPDGPMGDTIDAATAAAAARGVAAWSIGGAALGSAERALSLNLDVPEALTPLAFVVPGQLLTDVLARQLGISPDAPSGLTKVTRTR